jgi:hypothetical protein
VHGTDAEEEVGGGASRVRHGHWRSWGHGPGWAFAGGLATGLRVGVVGPERTGLRPAKTELRHGVKGRQQTSSVGLKVATGRKGGKKMKKQMNFFIFLEFIFRKRII